jgi:uncharacterized repeat protein (TIGR01451 family)
MRILLFCLFAMLGFNSYSQTVNITGRCFYDANGNNIFDGTDSVISGRIMSAESAAGNHYAIASGTGQFTMAVEVSSYIFKMSGYIASQNYQDIYSIDRTYTTAGNDIVDFAFQKRDSITELKAYISPRIQGNVQPSGSSKIYKLEYGYDGLLPSIPATLTLRFNPRVTIQSSSVIPTVSSPGFLQWTIPSINRNVYFNRAMDSIILNLNFAPVGDTIGQFVLSPKLVPNINITKPYYKFIFPDVAKVNHPPAQPVGTSTGVKWLRHYAPMGLWPQQDGISVDTAQDGNSYFVAGERSASSLFGGSERLMYISKLNKDGLSVWEKNIRQLPNGYELNGVTAIKHTGDGGCLVLGNAMDTNYVSTYRSGITVLRFNQVGDIIWTKNLLGSKYSEAGSDIVLLADGSFMITGTTGSRDGDFIHSNTDTSFDNIFVTKFSATGSVIFTKVYGGSKYDYANHLIPLQNGSFLILGATESNDGDVSGAHQHYTINPEQYYYGGGGFNTSDTVYSDEAWVININANGGINWNRCYGGRKFSYISGAIDNGAGILLSGYTNSKDGDLFYYPETQVSLWLQQVSTTNGSIIWNKLYKLYKGYEDSNYVSYPEAAADNYSYTDLQKTRDGNFITASVAADKYGTIKTKHGNGDMAFIKLSPTGNIIWQKTIGGTKSDYVNDFILDKNDDIIFTGASNSNNDDLYQNVEVDSGFFQPTLMIVGKLGITNIIKGQVFIDNNGNHIKDAGEILYSQGQVQSIKGTDTIAARIFDGKFLSNVDTGNYISTFRPINNYFTIYPVSKNSAFPTFDMTDSVDFALTPIPGFRDIEIQLLSLTTPRPGFQTTYRIITKNVAPTNINNVVVGFKYDSRLTYNSASRSENGMAVDSVWWGPFSLNAFTTDTLYVNFVLDAPPLLINGDTITNKVVANPVLGDYTTVNNQAVLRERVRGSFDPNDKTEVHAGTLSTTQYANGEYLQYLIRFQNTGTDTAFFITVKDTLQQKLDLTTLEVISASHPFTFKLEGQVATWDFKKILLPDSTSNEAGSHGFIVLRVKPKTGLIVGDEFTNKAAIYFDFNLPVITNEDKTLLGNNNGLCPNGSVALTSGLTGSTYQWQVNTGGSYVNLANGGIYSDVTSATLRLANIPTSYRGYKYRCVVNSNTYSPENKLRFEVTWTGAINTAWENPSNWDCGVLPDSKTDVVIPVSARYPLVGIAASCYSLQLAPNSNVVIKTGFNLLIAGVSGF